jgi:hypothetical protein
MATTSTRQRQAEGRPVQAEDTRNPSPANDAAHDDIARRAYERFEERGRQPGHDLDDWLQAEREIEGRST